MKICNHEGCKYNVFGGGFCKFHQRDRCDKDSKNRRNVGVQKKLNRSFKSIISKKSDKQRIKDKEDAELRKRDRELWAEIWAERPHIDFETEEPIYGEPLTLYFHHVLPKSEYPEFRYCKWNIVLVSWDTHAQAEAHCKLPKIEEYKKQLLKTKVK